jgi:hypothetical protein
MGEPFPPANDFTGNEPAWAMKLIARVELVGLKVDDVIGRVAGLETRMSKLEADFLQKWSTRQKLITIGVSVGTGLGTLLLSKVPALAPVLQQFGELLKGVG